MHFLIYFQEISAQHEGADDKPTAEFQDKLVLTDKPSTSRSQAPQPKTGARPKQQQKPQTSEASPVKTAKVRKQLTVGICLKCVFV